jgi:hypothetical protein
VAGRRFDANCILQFASIIDARIYSKGFYSPYTFQQDVTIAEVRSRLSISVSDQQSPCYLHSDHIDKSTLFQFSRYDVIPSLLHS